MLKIYCDTGAYLKTIAAHVEAGRVEVVQFQYENRNGRIKKMATPSRPRWRQMNYKWSELKGMTWADFGSQSEKWQPLLALVGKPNRTDAQHLDSAYMSGCQVFLTSDKGDIVLHREAIEALLGLKVFHVPAEWGKVLSLIESNG